MKERTRKTIYIATVILALGVFAVVAVRSMYDSSFFAFEEVPAVASVVPFSQIPTPETPATVSEPTEDKPVKVEDSTFTISIPSIKVKAKIEDVGINSLGNIATPKKLSNAGWYQYGAIPGEEGTTVLLGHVENGLGLPGVFHDLKDVEKGDDIYVTRKDGVEVHYVATTIDDYELATAPVHDILHHPSEPEALTIITCGKTWSGGKFHYDHRIVVTAIPA